MGDPPSPYAPPPPPPGSNLPMLYYGLVIICTAAIILALYNLVIVQWCTDMTNRGSRQRRSGGPTSSWRLRNSNVNPVPSFKYKRGDAEGGDTECAVCLSVFEEGEELRQMPKCKHSFHAPCIDMWLYSHMDCPLCRSPVGPPGPVLNQSEHSRQELLGAGTLV
ncbi:hypothetical protein ACP275_10G059900 [Erythranthe tilingii]